MKTSQHSSSRGLHKGAGHPHLPGIEAGIGTKEGLPGPVAAEVALFRVAREALVNPQRLERPPLQARARA
jgi:hypothetical protein